MAQKVAQLINTIREPATRAALQLMWDTLRKDLAANKTAYEAHTHEYNGADTAVKFSGKAATDAPDGTSITDPPTLPSTLTQSFEV